MNIYLPSHLPSDPTKSFEDLQSPDKATQAQHPPYPRTKPSSSFSPPSHFHPNPHALRSPLLKTPSLSHATGTGVRAQRQAQPSKDDPYTHPACIEEGGERVERAERGVDGEERGEKGGYAGVSEVGGALTLSGLGGREGGVAE